MASIYSDGESNDSNSSTSVEHYDYTLPEIEVPDFLNSDYKWNKNVVETISLSDFSRLIGNITTCNLDDEDKRTVMFYITTDIVMCHRYLSPHWNLLQYHAIFAGMSIL